MAKAKDYGWRLPPSQTSPYDFSSNTLKGSITVNQPKKKDDVYSFTKRSGHIFVPYPPSSRPSSGEPDMLAMLRAMRASMGGDYLFTDSEDDADRGVAKSADRRRLEHAEREARGSVKEWLLTGDLGVSWEDVVGNEQAHADLIEAIEFPTKHKELFEFYGKRATKGILLSGAPGCGKTMFGKAAASVMAKLHGVEQPAMISIKAPQLRSSYVGQTEERIKNIFAYAKAYKALHGHQLIVFIDEADAILPSRDGAGVPWYREANVAAFLAEMDGLEESGALVILATNRPNAINAAVLRDGRIDRKIVVQRPSEEAARAIFAKAIETAPVVGDRGPLVDYAMQEFFSPFRRLYRLRTEKGVDYMRLSDVVNGAMIVGLVERAKGLAFHRDVAAGARSGVTRDDIFASIDAVMKENMAQRDSYALREFAERIGVDAIVIEALQADIKIDVAAASTLN